MDEKQLARWLTERLTGDRARADWRRLVAAGWTHLAEQKLSVILPAKELEALALAYLTTEKLVELTRAQLRAGLHPIVRDMRADHAKVGRWVPAEARAAIDKLAARKGLIHPEWIRTLFQQEAIEALVNDTLYGALRDFSTIVPRLIQSISPLGKLAKLGGGIGARVVEEVEKRLEPEIRRFLEKGTRRALDGAARFAIDHLDDPTSVKLRRNMAGFVLDQEAAFHVHALSDELIAELEQIAVLIARHVSTSDEARSRLHEVITRAAERHGERPLREVLAEAGITESPPFDVWAEATFPAIAVLVASPGVEAWLEALSAELLTVIATP